MLNAESAQGTEFSGLYDMLINEEQITIRTVFVFVKFQQVGWTFITSNSNRGCRKSQSRLRKIPELHCVSKTHQLWNDMTFDLDLDSSRIQLDTLGHTPTPSVSVKSCHLCLLAPRWTPSFVGLCWLRPSSSLLVDLVLSCILVPASTVLAVLCALVHTEDMSKPAKSSFSQYVVQFWFRPPH